MLLYIFNENLDLLGLVEDYSYFKWHRRYSACGEFELKAAVNDKNIEQLVSGNILWKNDCDEAGIIEQLVIDDSIINVRGRFLTSLIDRRIIWGTHRFVNINISKCVDTLMSNHVIHPEDASRILPFWAFDANSEITTPVTFQVSYKNLLEVLESLCEDYDLGIRAVFQPKVKRFLLSLYKGADNAAVFSPDFENLLNPAYTENITGFSNVALVAGQGEGDDRRRVVIGSGTGLDRRELYVDARDLSPDEHADYDQALIQRGQQKLSECVVIRSFDAEINTRGNLEYRTDFDLGDMVTVFSRQLRKSLHTRITEVIETYEQDMMSVDLVFGNTLPTIADRLSKLWG